MGHDHCTVPKQQREQITGLRKKVGARSRDKFSPAQAGHARLVLNKTVTFLRTMLYLRLLDTPLFRHIVYGYHCRLYHETDDRDRKSSSIDQSRRETLSPEIPLNKSSGNSYRNGRIHSAHCIEYRKMIQ